MGLLGDVGQVEVGRERPHQVDCLPQVKLPEHRLQARPGLNVLVRADRLGEGPYLFDEIQQLRSVLTCHGVAQLRPETADVGPQAIIANILRSVLHAGQRLLTTVGVSKPCRTEFKASGYGPVWRLGEECQKGSHGRSPGAGRLSALLSLDSSVVGVIVISGPAARHHWR